MSTVYWLQGGGCGGDTFSFLSSELPDVTELFNSLNVELLWHPSLSNISPTEHERLVENILSGEQVLDLLLVEGSVICGPAGTGRRRIGVDTSLLRRRRDRRRPK